MKLHIVPARRGAQWVKLGIQTFLKQPLALAGLFFLFLAFTIVLNLLPIVGGLLASVLMPGLSLGLLAATREASYGKFPMPTTLAIAFRAGALQRRSMLALGAMYTVGTVIILCCTPLVDGGNFAKLMLLGQVPSEEARQAMGFQLAMLFAVALNMALLLLFCHAAALVHLHATPPLKSLFFGIAAIAGNFRAFVVYGLAWTGVFFGFSIIMTVSVAVAGSIEAVSAMALPAVMLLLTMFFTSIYFTFQDSFEFTPGDDI